MSKQLDLVITDAKTLERHFIETNRDCSKMICDHYNGKNHLDEINFSTFVLDMTWFNVNIKAAKAHIKTIYSPSLRRALEDEIISADSRFDYFIDSYKRSPLLTHKQALKAKEPLTIECDVIISKLYE